MNGVTGMALVRPVEEPKALVDVLVPLVGVGPAVGVGPFLEQASAFLLLLPAVPDGQADKPHHHDSDEDFQD